ncbi:helix-turn-helix domain-containing protein [Rubrivivax albus]|uniref:XRE family transcriptional regulator n=1 Tax=Rubrivivax albus TaxID=2499835 RepID=A0A3S2VWW8_9BURK|nr:helix-turn-helix transcriptional regulator [Rubrivivax albus]RVT51313.1 XRE family transcriptional regulator [Rubrivivax albus]
MASRPASVQHRFGARVRELRLASGLTQEDLAEHCGLFRTYMSRIETGVANPTLAMIEALATSLGVSIAELFPEPEARPAARSAAKAGSRGKVR